MSVRLGLFKIFTRPGMPDIFESVALSFVLVKRERHQVSFVHFQFVEKDTLKDSNNQFSAIPLNQKI